MQEISSLMQAEMAKQELDLSSEPQPQGLIPQKNGDPEQRFALALTDTRVANQPLEDFKGILKQIMVKVGLRAQNWPQDEEKAVLIAHILGQYGNHTTAEILLAFDMALSGQLDVEANCYENFSCLYFSGIMNAYRTWAAQAHTQATSEIKREPLPEPKEDLSDRAMADWLEQTKKEKLSVEFMPVMLYDWALKTELIAPTAKMKWEYLEKAVAYRQAKLDKALNDQMTPENRTALSTFLAMKEKGEFTGSEAEALKLLAKKMILYDFINF